MIGNLTLAVVTLTSRFMASNMETKATYTVDPIARIVAQYRRKWGAAYFEYAHVGGRGTVPTVHDGNGRGVILRRVGDVYREETR